MCRYPHLGDHELRLRGGATGVGPKMQFTGALGTGSGVGVEGRWQYLTRELDAAALDASRWKNVCDALAAVTDSAGTALIPFEAKHRGSWIINSDAVEGLMQTYVRDEWYKRDLRESLWPIMRRRGFATDFDMVDQSFMRRHPYYQDFLAGGGMSTFIGILIPTEAGDWVAAVQRSATNGLPTSQTLELLPRLRSMLAAAARSAQAIAGVGVDSWLSFFEGTNRGIAILDRGCRIKKMNAAAESLLSPFAGANGEIKLPNPETALQLKALATQACGFPARHPLPPPVLLPLAPGKFLSFDALPLPSALRHFYSDLAAVLIVRMAERAIADLDAILADRFHLSPAETRLALLIGKGISVREAADRAGIAFETARSRLKAIYAKTGTRRQSELALLVSEATRSSGSGPG